MDFENLYSKCGQHWDMCLSIAFQISDKESKEMKSAMRKMKRRIIRPIKQQMMRICSLYQEFGANEKHDEQYLEVWANGL